MDKSTGAKYKLPGDPLTNNKVTVLEKVRYSEQSENLNNLLLNLENIRVNAMIYIPFIALLKYVENIRGS